MIPWSETKWAKHNLQEGLKRSEICPGLTVGEHAESLAMFTMRNADVNNNDWLLAVATMTDDISKELYDGYYNPYEESPCVG